jgi:hypothetical protein
MSVPHSSLLQKYEPVSEVPASVIVGVPVGVFIGVTAGYVVCVFAGALVAFGDDTEREVSGAITVGVGMGKFLVSSGITCSDAASKGCVHPEPTTRAKTITPQIKMIFIGSLVIFITL